MPSTQKVPQKATRTRPPATTPEARENQLIALAYDLVEKRLMAGTASSQETVHFLKRASSKEKLEKEILEQQKELIKAKTESIQSAKKLEALYLDALNAMKTYAGNGQQVGEDDSNG